ncbi:FMN-binding protein [Prevotella sp. Rep29]|uniref:FMN-binding protein n=1 Tax=Prevotella sp. Rep29 TaxID=2691580 RepID=UPI001C6F47CB|nr:FMN-binding protein [Prevotella sp. Rep29]QYR09979.1 FMN-binding protein [Prevotella sp. Rep29]
MKKGIIRTFSLALTAVFCMSAMPGDNVITKEGKTTIINTTTIGKNIEGYNGATPLKIYIEKNKIVKIEALANDETPKYFHRVKKTLLDKWNGMTVKKAVKANVDVVTGATYSSDAVIKNVQKGLKYYMEKK